MSKICLLLSQMLGSRKTPAVVTYSITGNIADAGATPIESVTVNLTGDATDDTTTDASGDYAFTGISDGTYTVTPSKTGYIFTPTDDEVVISGGDDTSDFVATAVWTISGSIVDGAAAGIEGVTVTLSGDADDSTTTDGDGAYSFAGVSDGSYTVTPTLSNLKMTPASRAANVSGDNVAVDNIVGQHLLLPYTYSFSALAPTSGGLIAQLDDWYARTDGLTDPQFSTSVADSNSFTPTGVSKGVIVQWGATRDFAANLLPYKIDSSLTSLRFAVLFKESNGDRLPGFGVDAVLPTNATTAELLGYIDGGTNPDKIYAYASYEAARVTEINGQQTGANADTRRYHWIRFEFNFTDDKVRVSLVRAEDSAASFATIVDAMDASGTTLNHVPSNLAYFWITNNVATASVLAVKYWVGTASDDWPA